MFIIKNSDIGRSFIFDLIEKYKYIELDQDNNITSGIWTGSNYEQGIMNLLLKTNNDYTKNTVTLPEFIFNTTVILDDVFNNSFLWHLPGRSAKLRSKRFKKIINENKL